jgi:hypothetical protein
MKTKLLLFLMCVCTSIPLLAQDNQATLDAPLGYRVKRNGQDYIIYKDNGLVPNENDYRKINYKVYFRKVNVPVKDFKNKKYQLITIPGSRKPLKQNDVQNLLATGVVGARIGATINSEDYDQNFWIEVEVIENETNTEYYKYSNDVFSGLLTAPFKYRLKVGNAPESLLDGDFNIAPFIGWKFRISSVKAYYIAPFGFAGITSLKYNSDNNSGLAAGSGEENGSGITYGAGISIRLGDVSPGFIVGWDHGLGNLGSSFVYSDKPWISFSLNYDFFKPSKTSENQAPANSK